MKVVRGRLALQKHSARNQGNTHLISGELVTGHGSSHRFCARTPLRMIDENSQRMGLAVLILENQRFFSPKHALQVAKRR